MPVKVLLCETKKVLGIIPWLDYGIHKNNKNTNISIFNLIPRSSRWMTTEKG
ncbi:hypothetical protein [Candidatus Rickettsia kedanie]